MPSWDTASQRKIPDHHGDERLGMGRLNPLAAQQEPMLTSAGPPPRTGYAEADSSPVLSPYQHQGGFQGGDLGSPYGQQQGRTAYTGYASPAPSFQGRSGAGYGQSQAYGRSTQQQDFNLDPYGGGHRQQYPHSAYSAYTPSTSTRYEPTVNYQQQTGVVYNSRSPPPQHTSIPPSILGVGRKPVQGSWRDT
ncbi:hypothetical protein MMC16_002491 [Acarospora aff. strigata]|nr:hypothetical protein [Acarospora aff. strigata]